MKIVSGRSTTTSAMAAKPNSLACTKNVEPTVLAAVCQIKQKTKCHAQDSVGANMNSCYPDLCIATDKHLEPPLEKVNKQVGFRDPSLRTLLNKSTLRTFFFSRVHLEPPQDIILYLIFTYKCIWYMSILIYIYIILSVCWYIYIYVWFLLHLYTVYQKHQKQHWCGGGGSNWTVSYIYIYTIWWVFSILMVHGHKFHFKIHLFFKFQFKKVLKH